MPDAYIRRMTIPMELIWLANDMPKPINGGASPSLEHLMRVSVALIREQWPNAILTKNAKNITDEEAVKLGGFLVKKDAHSDVQFDVTSIDAHDPDRTGETCDTGGMPVCLCLKGDSKSRNPYCDCVFNGNEGCGHLEEFELCLDVNCGIVEAIEYACEA